MSGTAGPCGSKRPHPLGGRRLRRRQYLKWAGLGLAGLAGGGAARASRASPAPERTRRLAMVIDLRRCTGCCACAVACKSEHFVSLGGFRSWVTPVEMGRYPRPERFFLPRLCNHCKHPPCVKVCPVGASQKREDGLVFVDKDICIGCRYCMVACPYGMRHFNWPRGVKTKLAWPSRRYGVVDKCDFCKHRIDEGVVPACVNTCHAKARIFGDLHDPESEVARRIEEAPSVQVLAPELGTEPSVFYIGLPFRVAEAALAAGCRFTPFQVEEAGGVEGGALAEA